MDYFDKHTVKLMGWFEHDCVLGIVETIKYDYQLLLESELSFDYYSLSK